MKRVRALLAALVTACGLLSGAADVLAANAGKLETVSEETVNSWEKLLYHPENGQFVLIHRAGSVQGEIFHLRLTVKAAVAEEEGKIAVRSLSASDGMEDLTPEDALLTLALLSSETEGGAGRRPGGPPCGKLQ